MIHFIRKIPTIILLSFCSMFFSSLVCTQENIVAGAYEYKAQNGTYIQFYLSPNHRFALALESGSTILEIRGKYTIKGDSVYFEQDKTAQTFFDIYATYNPAIPKSRRIIYNYLPKTANTMFSINKTYNIATFITPGLDYDNGSNWNKKDISLEKGNKLWLYTTNNLHYVEEYTLPETSNEINIVPDLSQTGHFKLPRKIKAVLTTQKNLIADLGLGTGGLQFKHITDPLNQEDRQKLEKPLPGLHLHTKKLNYTTIKINRQFEDKNTDTLTIIDEEPPYQPSKK